MEKNKKINFPPIKSFAYRQKRKEFFITSYNNEYPVTALSRASTQILFAPLQRTSDTRNVRRNNKKPFNLFFINFGNLFYDRLTKTMEKNMGMPSPEEMAKIEKSRTISDAELLKGGAEYSIDNKGEKSGPHITAEQYKKIKEFNFGDSIEDKGEGHKIKEREKDKVKEKIGPSKFENLKLKYADDIKILMKDGSYHSAVVALDMEKERGKDIIWYYVKSDIDLDSEKWTLQAAWAGGFQRTIMNEIFEDEIESIEIVRRKTEK